MLQCFHTCSVDGQDVNQTPQVQLTVGRIHCYLRPLFSPNYSSNLQFEEYLIFSLRGIYLLHLLFFPALLVLYVLLPSFIPSSLPPPFFLPLFLLHPPPSFLISPSFTPSPALLLPPSLCLSFLPLPLRLSFFIPLSFPLSSPLPSFPHSLFFHLFYLLFTFIPPPSLPPSIFPTSCLLCSLVFSQLLTRSAS